MTNRSDGDDTDILLKLAGIGVGLYVLYKLLVPSETSKEIYRCGNCNGVLIGRPDYCRWCHVELDWEGV